MNTKVVQKTVDKKKDTEFLAKIPSFFTSIYD